MDKVYLVYAVNEDFGCCDTLMGVFKTKEEADKYAEIQNQLDPYEYYPELDYDEFEDECLDDTSRCKYYVREEEFSNVDMNAKVVKYYYYLYTTDFYSLDHIMNTVYKGEDCELSEEELIRKYNHPEERYINIVEDNTQNRIYDKDLLVEENICKDEFIVYSINSYEEAKNLGLKLWEEAINDYLSR